MKFDNLDDLLDLIAIYVHSLYEKDAINERECVELLDTFKMAMGEYSRLLNEGKIPENQQFKYDFAKGLDAMNEALEDEEI